MDTENILLLLSVSLMCLIQRRGVSGLLVPVLFQGERQGLEVWGVLSTLYSPSRQPWDPMDSRFITKGLKHQMNHCLLMGLVASGVSPSGKLTSSFSEGFWPCCLTHLDNRSAAVAARSPGGQREDGGGERRKAPVGDIL